MLSVLVILTLFLMVFFSSCIQTQNEPEAKLSVEMIDRSISELFGLTVCSLEIHVEGIAETLEITTDVHQESIPISGRQRITVSDFLTDIQSNTIKIQLIDDKQEVIAEQSLPLSAHTKRPEYSQFNEGIYFVQTELVRFYQLEYLSQLRFTERVELYYQTQDETITTYAMLLKGGQARFCLYADYPVDTDDPVVDEFPHERVFDHENGWYLNPKEEGIHYYRLETASIPETAGETAGDGFYEEGQTVTIAATPAHNFRFVNWTKDDLIISIQAHDIYTMPDENVTLAANFEEQKPPTLIEPSFSNMWNQILPPTFTVTTGAMDPDGDLANFYFALFADDEMICEIELLSIQGISQFRETREVEVDLEGVMERSVRYFVFARDKEGNTATMDCQGLMVTRRGVGLIIGDCHLGTDESVDLAESLGNFSPDSTFEEIPEETATVYDLPFGITTLLFEIFPEEAVSPTKAELYLYTNLEDVFNRGAQFKRGESESMTLLERGSYQTAIEFANLTPEQSIWLALYIQGATNPWFVWKISALEHSTTPQVTVVTEGMTQGFKEGDPLQFEVNLKDEMLISLDDLTIAFTDQDGTIYLEEFIHHLNQHLWQEAESTPKWFMDDSWRFAIRYHAKVTFENFPEAYEDIRKRDMEPDPDPKTVYAISEPLVTYDGTDPDHIWHRYNGETGEKINWDLPGWLSNDLLYYFGVLDSHIASLIRPEYITDIANMTVQLYPEIVVVEKESNNQVLFVADAALGAANALLAERVSESDTYQVIFKAQNAKGDIGESESFSFPIVADNTSPEINITYGSANESKYFADRRPEDLVSKDTRDNIAPPMFFVDSISLYSGESFTVKAVDHHALYDFAVFFTSDEADQSPENWRTNLPAIMNPTLETANLPMGYDFLYKAEDEFYTGQTDANKNKEDKPTMTLNEILINEPDPVIAKALYTQIYAKTLPGNIYGNFSIDNRFEIYENYTWSGVRNVRETALINVEKQEQYFTRKTDDVTKQISMPSVPGTYWVWIIARDRGAQDSWLFDYENSRVNIDPLTGEPEIYEQDVLYNQNNFFTVNPNLEDVEIYYENSESESDASMAILLRVRVQPHSMDIQRLDIHEPDLIGFPSTDDYGDVWYAHSYNVLQLDEETKVNEFDEGESRGNLPRELYPVYIQHFEDRDAGNKFGLTPSGAIMFDNLWGAVEDQEYGNYTHLNDPSIEAIPVVGGNQPTIFRIKTHEDIEKVQLELIDQQAWTVSEYCSMVPTILASTTIVKDYSCEGKGMSGYWEWPVQLSAFFDGSNQPAAIVVKASGTFGEFYQQWQWPIWVDVANPEISSIQP